MKPILPLFISLSLAAGPAFAQQIELADGESAPAAEESASDEPAETAEEESSDEPVDEDVENQTTDESSEDSAGEPADEPAAESDEDTAQEAEEASVEDLFPESAAADEDVDMPEGDNEVLAETEVEEEVPVVADPAPPQPGLAVRVERVQGTTAVDPSEVQLRAPFPAKLLAGVPEGWRIEKSDRAPAFTREVELSPGSNITLSVQPHILVPDADGTHVFAVNEPGYQSDLGYRQDATVGAILATSIRQLDDDTRHLGEAIDQLQQLLVSLPRPEPAAAQDQPAPGRKR
jgi:hypothetical protein